MLSVSSNIPISMHCTSFPGLRRVKTKINFAPFFAGNYICSASNGVGKTQERVISLEVEFPPKIDVPKPKVPQAAFYEAHLVCEIQV